MGYPKELTESHWLILNPVLEGLNKLKDGELLTLTYSGAGFTERVRQTFYAWMFINNKKSLYKLRRISPTKLQIQKLEYQDPTIDTVCEKLRPYEEFVIDNLLDVFDEDEAIMKVQASSLTPEERVKAILEWRRKIEKRD